MKNIVIYDSLYGNTQAIAEAIGKNLGPDTEVLHVKEAALENLRGIDLLIVGSPTHGGRPSPATKDFLRELPSGSLKGVRVAAFDTGIPAQGQGTFMRTLVKVLGYAGKHIQKALENKGAVAIAAPQSFAVKDKEGPLQEGELERAGRFAQEIIRKINA